MTRIFRGPLNSVKNSKAFFDSLNPAKSLFPYFSSFVDGSNVFTDNPNFTESSCEEPECKGCSCDGSACDEQNPCPQGCICCNGVCVEEIPEGECCGACEENEDCAPGCVCVDGECVPGIRLCDSDEDCPEGKCCEGECISVDQCCEYAPCECPPGRVPVQNGPRPDEPGFLGCCPPEYPFDVLGFCANGEDMNAEDYEEFDGIGPYVVCPEGCICGDTPENPNVGVCLRELDLTPRQLDLTNNPLP